MQAQRCRGHMPWGGQLLCPKGVSPSTCQATFCPLASCLGDRGPGSGRMDACNNYPGSPFKYGATIATDTCSVPARVRNRARQRCTNINLFTSKMIQRTVLSRSRLARAPPPLAAPQENMCNSNEAKDIAPHDPTGLILQGHHGCRWGASGCRVHMG